VSEAPVKPGTPSQLSPGPSPLSEGSKRKLARLAGLLTLVIASLAALIAGIAIGNAARKRIDRWGHAYY
jgi:hypothetical protein